MSNVSTMSDWSSKSSKFLRPFSKLSSSCCNISVRGMSFMPSSTCSPIALMSSFTINSSATRSMFLRSPSNPSKNCFSLALPPTALSSQSKACPAIASSNEAPCAMSVTTSFIVSICPGVILSITESDTPNEPRPFFIQPSPKSDNTGRIALLISPVEAALIIVMVCLAVIPPKPIPATLIAVCEATKAL